MSEAGLEDFDLIGSVRSFLGRHVDEFMCSALRFDEVWIDLVVRRSD